MMICDGTLTSEELTLIKFKNLYLQGLGPLKGEPVGTLGSTLGSLGSTGGRGLGTLGSLKDASSTLGSTGVSYWLEQRNLNFDHLFVIYVMLKQISMTTNSGNNVWHFATKMRWFKAKATKKTKQNKTNLFYDGRKDLPSTVGRLFFNIFFVYFWQQKWP